MTRLFAALAALLLLGAVPPPRAPLVLAAASLREAVSEAAEAFARSGGTKPVLSFAASSALARQVEAGARADLFVSADEEWMDVLARGRRLAPGTRAVMAGNRLVVVAPRGSGVLLTRANLGAALSRGRVAMADPAAVPAGRYGEAALRRLGAWPAVAPRVVRAENVRAALALVERGAVPFAIVYLTDARASRLVRVAGVFPAASHPPIRYPIARLVGGEAATQAEGFRRFLLGREGRAILRRRGFSVP